MFIKSHQLEVGDEFIMPCHSFLKYCKCIGHTKANSIKYSFNDNYYSLSDRNEEVQDCSKHNKIAYLSDRDYHTVWLVKKSD